MKESNSEKQETDCSRQDILRKDGENLCLEQLSYIRKKQATMGYIRKQKLPEMLLRMAADSPALYISGSAGIGKTKAVKMYRDHMIAQGRSVSMLDMRVDAERETLEKQLEEGGQVEPRIRILDHLSECQDEKLLVLLARAILSGEPGKDTQWILVSRTVLPKQLYPCVQENRLHVLEGAACFYDEKTLLSLLAQEKIKFTYRQTRKLLQWSGGWPAIVHIALGVIRQQGTPDILPRIPGHPMMQQFIREEIWDNLTPAQQKLCLQLAVLPGIPPCILTGETGWIRRQLMGLCILTEQEQGTDAFPDFFREFLLAESARRGEEASILSQAGDWFRKSGMYPEALDCFYRAKDPVSHRACMISGCETLFWEIEDDGLLWDYLKFSMEQTEEAESTGLFFKGMLWMEAGAFPQGAHALEQLKKAFQNTKSRKDGLLYLNLLYYDPGVSILQWMEEALSVTVITGAIHIYGLTHTGLSVLSGGKDLSILFCRKKKEIESFRDQWNHIFEEEQQDFFHLAEIEYLMETNRQEEALEQLLPCLVIKDVEDIEDGAKPDRYQTVLFVLLCKSFILSDALTGYEALMDTCYEQIQRTGNGCEKRNSTLQRILCQVWKKQRTLHQAFAEDEKEDYMAIGRKNSFYLLQKARYYLFLRKYEKAYMLFERLYRHYETCHQYLYQVESGLGQAVAARNMGRESEALKRMAATVTLAECYRYVGVFCLFGITGRELLDDYWRILRNPGSSISQLRKKSYYYGNVIGTSVENYLNVLMRSARNSVSRYPFAQNQDTDRGEDLTMTELSILQYIEQGDTNARIAEQMNIAESTVKKHVYNIFRKLEVKTRVQAIQKGKQIGILTR